VQLPAPVWNVTPPAQPGAQPVAAAVIEPPAPEGYEFGDALWVKVFVTELPEAVDAEDLDHMVIDDPNVNIVPDEPAEVEIEWVLLQASTENEGEQEFGGAAEVGEGNEAVSRRFEFYKYVGAYDSESHEALCDDPADCPEAVGDIIGAQNVAINLAGPVGAPNSSPLANADSVSTTEDVALTIAPATLLANDSDANGDPLTITSVQNPAGGTVALGDSGVVFTPSPNFNGSGSFTYTVDDGGGGTATATVGVTVTSVDDPPVANAGPNRTVRMRSTVTLDGTGSSDAEGNAVTYFWRMTSKPANSRPNLRRERSPNPYFVADMEGTYVVTLVVSDGTTSSTASVVTITSERR
jgi:hypothetical protein